MGRAHYNVDLATDGRSRPSRAGALLLAAGLALAGWAGWSARQVHAAQADELATLARLEAAVAARNETRRAATLRVPTAGERRLQSDLAKVAGELARPWFPMLDRLEAHAVSQVVLQQLSVDTGFTRLQLRVDAADLPEVLQYVRRLDAAGAPLQGAQLVGHEWQGGVVAGGAPRRLQARIAVGLLPQGVAAVPPPAPGGIGCGAGDLSQCLSAKATP